MGLRIVELACVEGESTAATSESSCKGMRMIGACIRRTGEQVLRSCGEAEGVPKTTA